MEYIPSAAEFKQLHLCKPGKPSFYEPIKPNEDFPGLRKIYENQQRNLQSTPTFGKPAGNFSNPVNLSSNFSESDKPGQIYIFGAPPGPLRFPGEKPASNFSESVKPGPPTFGKPPGRAGFNSPIPTFHSTTSRNSGLQLIVDEIDKLELEFVKKVAWLNLAVVLRTSLSTELILVKWRDLFRPVDYSFRKEEYIKPVVFDVLKAKGYKIQEGFDDGFLLSV